MELMLEQVPIVIRSLNVGFLQTLKLFFVTLLGAVPLGLAIAFFYKDCCLDYTRNTADDSAFDHLLFSRAGARETYLGRR